MKKIIALVLTAALTLSVAACGSSGTAESGKTISGTPEEIIAKIYETVDVNDEDRDFLQNSLGTIPVEKENAANFFGVDTIEFTEAVASEPMMSSIAFSICLMRVKEGTDIEAAKADIKANVDPRKWICVEVDPSDVRVESEGDLILLIMAEDSEKYSEAFHALAK